MKSTTIVATPLNLWKHLKSDAGLEVQVGKGRKGRDKDLEASILSQLELSCGITLDGRSLEQTLRDDAAATPSQINVEKLLVAVLVAVGPFSKMMRDILELLELADTRQSEHSLTFDFRFDEVNDPIRVTLEQFRQEVERIQTLVERKFELPPADRLWDIWRALQPNHNKLPSYRNVYGELNPPSPCPRSGNPELDRKFARLHELVSEFRDWCSSFGSGRKDAAEHFRLLGKGHPGYDEKKYGLAVAATDFWDSSILGIIEDICRDVKIGAMDPSPVIASLARLLDNIPRRSELVERSIKELLDILQLPAWKKRHELFAVWTGSVLLKCAYQEATELKFHPKNDVLSFSFAGARLATYKWNGDEFEIWCELRTPLTRTTSRKRKEGIQPDFRVLEASIWDRNQGTRLVLECKHYLQQVVTNFAEAVNDYAHSCAAAHVVLVNYGPINAPSLLAAVDTALAGRVSFLGDVTPMEEEIGHRLANAIQSVLFPRVTGAPGINASTAPGLPGSHTNQIRLVWNGTLSDMDLSLVISDLNPAFSSQVDYRTKGDLDAPPYALLDRDVQAGPGEEVIVVSRWHGSKYDVYVRDFSRSENMRAPHLHCEIVMNGHMTRISFPSGISGGEEWHVASIDVSAESVKAVNKVT